MDYTDDSGSGSEADLNQTLQTQEDPDITQQQLNLVDDIKSGSFHLDLDVVENVEEFLARYSGIIVGGEHGTLIHVALQSLNSKSFDHFKPLFRLLVSKYPKLLETRNRQGETALHFAIQQKQGSVTLFLCKNAPREAVTRAIGCRGQAKGNCLHAAIRMLLRPHVVVQLISMCEKPSLLDQDDHGFTPFHLAVDFARYFIRGNEDVVDNLMARCPEAAYTLAIDNLSPFRFHLQTRHDFHELLKRLKARQDSSVHDSLTIRIVDAIWRTQERKEHLKLETPPEGQEAGAATSLPLKRTTQGNDEMKKSPTNKPTSHMSVDEVKAASDRLRHTLKILYLRTQSIPECVRLLYGGPGTESKELYFDLSGASKVTASFLSKLRQIIHLESALVYVVLSANSFLPPLDNENAIKKGHRGLDAEDANMVFEWLRLNGVEKIIRVAILDDFDRPHCEETIEASLKWFDVEELDWMKKDICSETIRCAAPNVRILHLYWSGSNPVLRAWSEPDGFARLAKLEKVILTASQGIETRSRARENVEIFLRRLVHSIAQERPEAPVQISWQFDDDNMTKGSYTTSSLRISSFEPWISHLLKVAEFLSSFPQARHQEDSAAPRKFRVCLIDDGVDFFADLQAHEQLAGGASFSHSETTCRISPWYISEENHGTNMARLLQKCAPGMTELYVAKVDIVNGRLSPATVNKALEWAMDRGVDMICIGRPVDGSVEHLRLRDEMIMTIRTLHHKQITVLCASPSRLDALAAGGPNGLLDLGYWGSNLLQVCPWAREDKWDRKPWHDDKSRFFVPIDGLPSSQDDASAKTNLDDASLAVALGCALSALVFFVAQRSGEPTSVNPMALKAALSSMVGRGEGEGFVDVSRLSRFIEHQTDTSRQEKPEQLIDALDKMARYLFEDK